VIGLSLKSDHIDKFWFNLWHEIEHVLSGDGKEELILDDFDNPTTDQECERAAKRNCREPLCPSQINAGLYCATRPDVLREKSHRICSPYEASSRHCCWSDSEADRTMGSFQETAAEGQGLTHSGRAH
jgi:hypothetical protein